MLPVLIGAAVIGGIGYALSGNDKSSTKVYYTDEGDGWYCEETRREISESEVPPAILKKIKNSSRQFNEEFLLESEVPEVREISASRILPDILRKLKRQ